MNRGEAKAMFEPADIVENKIFVLERVEGVPFIVVEIDVFTEKFSHVPFAYNDLMTENNKTPKGYQKQIDKAKAKGIIV